MVLIFRSVGVMNFAQGEFLMFGGYFCYTFNKILNLPIVLSLVLASLSMGVVGILFMRTSYWPLRSAQAKAIIVSAMGASIVFKEGARLIWGSIPVTMDRVIQGTAHLGQATIQWQNVAIIAISAIIMALVYMLLEKTFVGNIMQATAQDQYMASLTGVPVIVSIGLTFALSAMITGIGGGLLAPIFFLNNTMGATAGAKLCRYCHRRLRQRTRSCVGGIDRRAGGGLWRSLYIQYVSAGTDLRGIDCGSDVPAPGDIW